MAIISVIVPVYKVEDYLPRCVRSILGQRFSDFELILVDDGSPDSCGSLCDAFALEDPRIHVIHRENGGLSAARNSGIDFVMAHSDSQWLTFVDSDDWVHPDYLKVLYDAATEHSCLLSACGCLRTAGKPLPEDPDCTANILSSDGYYCDNFHGVMTPTACGKLYHRTLLKTLRYPQGKLHEDEFTTYRMVYQAGKVAATKAALYAYYENPQSITLSKWNPRRLDVLEGMAGQITFAVKNYNKRLWEKVSLGYILSAYEHLHQADPDHQPLVRKKLRWGLKQGRKSGVFPLMWFNIWAYEAAYPWKFFWWVVGKFRPSDEELIHGR